MPLPKIKFIEMTLQENIDIIKWAYYRQNGSLDIHEYTIKYFPKLATLENNISQEQVYKKIEEVVTEDYGIYKEKIQFQTQKYNDLWKPYNDNYMKELSNYLGVNWPNNIEIIECTVGLIPVFPRYLDAFTFSIGTNIEDWKLIETCAHETLHFLWFEKWKQLHPETSRREYDSPYDVWKYSEMVTDPILNNEPFKGMFCFKEHGYDSFYEIYDGDNLVMDNLRNIYSEDIPVEEKIDKGIVYASRNILIKKNFE